MKKQLIFFLASFTFVALFFTRANAATIVSPQEMRSGFAEKLRAHPESFAGNDARTSKRMNKIAKRLERKMLKHGMQVDFSDPVDQWLWFGIFGLGIAILLSFFNIGVGGLIAFLAVVCLVIWVVKRGAV